MRLSPSSLLTFLLAVMFYGLPMCAGQSILWDQQPNTNLTPVIDLEVPEPSAEFSTYLVNDVTFFSTVSIDSVTTYFSNNTGTWPSIISEARFTFFPGDFTPFDPRIDGELVPVTVTELPGGVLAVTAAVKGLNSVPAGVYWIGLTPVLDSADDLQEFRFDAGSTIGGETFGRNPAGVFGLGTDWFPASVLSTGFGDAAITVTSPPLTPPVEFPENGTIVRGFENDGVFESVCFSDDEAWIFNPGFILNSKEAPVWVEFEGPPFFFDFDIGNEIGIVVESQANTPGLTLTVEEFNFSNNSYEVIGEVSESFGEDTERFFAATGHESSTGESRFRLGWRQTGIVLLFPWEVQIDQVLWSRIGLP